MTIIATTTTTFSEPNSKPFQKMLAAGLDIKLNPYGRKLTEAESIGFLAESAAVIAGTSPLSRKVLDALPHLQVISRCGTGVDNVDLTAVQERNIRLYTTPDSPSQAVAELTLGMMLGLLRHIPAADRQIRRGDWKPITGNLLSDQTVGFIGLGRVARHVVEFLRPFHTRILAHDIVMPGPDYLAATGVTMVDLPQLLQQADIVSLHIPYTPDTHHLIGAEQLALMKSSALLINTARGNIVDEAALLDVLQQGRLHGAALDTFSREPYSGPLAEMDNVLLTAHMGSAAEETRAKMEIEAVDNMLAGLEDVGLL